MAGKGSLCEALLVMLLFYSGCPRLDFVLYGAVISHEVGSS